jgi:uncharacterized membrane protein
MNMLRSQLKTLLSGILALLPLIVTLALLIWVSTVLHRFIGRESQVGKFFSSIGLAFVTNEVVAYLLGMLFFLVLAYALGIVVQSRFRRRLQTLTDSTFRRIPLIGPIYDLASRFVGLLEKREPTAAHAMSPVWCFFGGEGGAAVLALMPNPEPIALSGRAYVAVLVPTAPVPLGGGLLYVPADWVKPAGFGMDRLTSVYVSMGVAPPSPMIPAGT